MVQRGKEAGLHARGLHAGSASDESPDAQDGRSDENGLGANPATERTVLSDHTRNRLAVQLRAMYDTIAQQPIPDRFAELIAKLDSGDGRKA